MSATTGRADVAHRAWRVQGWPSGVLAPATRAITQAQPRKTGWTAR
jgi:hypothetical protein